MMEEKAVEIKRGDIFWVENEGAVGSEEGKSRSCIIVSNNMANRYSPVLEVVYVTCKEKKDLPTHVTIRRTQTQSTALCEQITTISTRRLKDKVGHLTKTEIDNIDIALAISLGIEMPAPKKPEPKPVFQSPVMPQKVADPPKPEPKPEAKPDPKPVEKVEEPAIVKVDYEDQEELLELRGKYKLLKEMYDKLLDKVVG